MENSSQSYMSALLVFDQLEFEESEDYITKLTFEFFKEFI